MKGTNTFTFQDTPPAGSTGLTASAQALAAFQNELTGGDWSLVITNGGASQNVALKSWSLILPHTTSDNEVFNGSANAINVVFDRDIDPSTLATASGALSSDVLQMMGPLGTLYGGSIVTTTAGAPPPAARPPSR